MADAFLVIGSVLLVFIFNVNNPDLFAASFLLAVGAVPLAILTGIAYDLEQSNIRVLGWKAVKRRAERVSD